MFQSPPQTVYRPDGTVSMTIPGCPHHISFLPLIGKYVNGKVVANLPHTPAKSSDLTATLFMNDKAIQTLCLNPDGKAHLHSAQSRKLLYRATNASLQGRTLTFILNGKVEKGDFKIWVSYETNDKVS